MSVSLLKPPAVPASDSAGFEVHLPAFPVPFLVWRVLQSPDECGPGYVRLFGAFDTSPDSEYFRTLPGGQALPLFLPRTQPI